MIAIVICDHIMSKQAISDRYHHRYYHHRQALPNKAIIDRYHGRYHLLFDVIVLCHSSFGSHQLTGRLFRHSTDPFAFLADAAARTLP